jgi:hypothetical protein
VAGRAEATAALKQLATSLSPRGQATAKYGAIRAQFVRRLTAAARAFLNGGNQRAAANVAKKAMTELYHAAAEIANGGDIEGDVLAMVNAKVNEQSEFVEEFFGDLNLQREAKDKSVPDARIEQYASSLDATFNEVKAGALARTMLTMDGEDGNESCKDCRRYKGQRHSAQWWIDHGLLPGQPGNQNYECKGFHCEHFLRDDAGNRFTL